MNWKSFMAGALLAMIAVGTTAWTTKTSRGTAKQYAWISAAGDDIVGNGSPIRKGVTFLALEKNGGSGRDTLIVKGRDMFNSDNIDSIALPIAIGYEGHFPRGLDSAWISSGSSMSSGYTVEGSN